MKKVLQGVFNYLKHTDKWLLGLCIICAGFSMLLLYSIYYNGFLGSIRALWIQLASTVLGIAAVSYTHLTLPTIRLV